MCPNCARRSVWRTNLIAAIALFWSLRSLCRSFEWKASKSSLQGSVHVGQSRRIWCTVIAAESHAQCRLKIVGTLRWKRKSLKPITPILSWMRRALNSLLKPAWSLRVAGVQGFIYWCRNVSNLAILDHQLSLCRLGHKQNPSHLSETLFAP